MIRFILLVAVFAQAVAAHQEPPSWTWALGVDVPVREGGTSLWATSENWGYGLTLGGPVFDLSCCAGEDLYYASGLFTLQRFAGRILYFGEAGYKVRGRDSHREKRGGYIKARFGVGVSRRYKDFGVFVSYGFGYNAWDGAGLYEKVGLDSYPRVVAYWVL